MAGAIHPPEVRAEALDLYERGMSIEQISAEKGMGPSALADWVRQTGTVWASRPDTMLMPLCRLWIPAKQWVAWLRKHYSLEDLYGGDTRYDTKAQQTIRAAVHGRRRWVRLDRADVISCGLGLIVTTAGLDIVPGPKNGSEPLEER